MKFMSPLIVVKDMERTKRFYKEVLGSKVILDLVENVTFSGGFAAQTEETWLKFIGKEKEDLKYAHNCGELYFEEDDFDGFLTKFNKISDIKHNRGVIEHEWGQRSIRFYDPDGNMIEVGETLKNVCRRFLDSGMSIEEVSKKSLMPVSFVKRCADNKK